MYKATNMSFLFKGQRDKEVQPNNNRTYMENSGDYGPDTVGTTIKKRAVTKKLLGNTIGNYWNYIK